MSNDNSRTIRRFVDIGRRNEEGQDKILEYIRNVVELLTTQVKDLEEEQGRKKRTKQREMLATPGAGIQLQTALEMTGGFGVIKMVCLVVLM